MRQLELPSPPDLTLGSSLTIGSPLISHGGETVPVAIKKKYQARFVTAQTVPTNQDATISIGIILLPLPYVYNPSCIGHLGK